MGITAWLWNPLVDFGVLWLINEFKNICAGIIFLVLDFNKILWKFITMHDDTDMNNIVTYHTYLEDRIFKILLMENRTISPWMTERFQIQIMELLG